jgi:2-polyprenyl-3-methyl-5-hydroxy-6-metoxy-1,4-benzoquinol methylase
MGDSSEHALTIAKEILPDNVTYYQLDLMDLKWQERWDVVFLLDVIEHCPNDIEIMKQVFSALKPGGRLFITTPALMNFWSYNDVLANHLKRYNKSDFEELAKKANLKLIDSYYFMFFLSPLYWLVRKFKFSKNKINLERAFKKNHRTPNIVVNYILSLIFLAESYIGLTMRFPWGTSIVGIFEKPKFDKPPFGVQDSNL